MCMHACVCVHACARTVCVHTCVHVCVCTCVVTRGHQLSLSYSPLFFFSHGFFFFTEPAEAHTLVTLAGQQDPELSLCLSLQCMPSHLAFYLGSGDPSSGPRA